VVRKKTRGGGQDTIKKKQTLEEKPPFDPEWGQMPKRRKTKRVGRKMGSEEKKGRKRTGGCHQG